MCAGLKQLFYFSDDGTSFCSLKLNVQGPLSEVSCLRRHFIQCVSVCQFQGWAICQRTRRTEARNSHGFNVTVTYRCFINYSGYLASRVMRPTFGELVRIREEDGMAHLTLIMSRSIKAFVRFQLRSHRASMPGMSAILH